MTVLIREQRDTHVPGETLKAAPSANDRNQGYQRTERHQSKHDVLGKKRECAEHGDAQKVAAGTGPGINHDRVETIPGGSDGKPAFSKSLEEQFGAIQEHHPERDQPAQRGEDYHASSNNYDRRQHYLAQTNRF